jgi:hypothetical protein
MLAAVPLELDNTVQARLILLPRQQNGVGIEPNEVALIARRVAC